MPPALRISNTPAARSHGASMSTHGVEATASDVGDSGGLGDATAHLCPNDADFGRFLREMTANDAFGTEVDTADKIRGAFLRPHDRIARL